MDGTIYRSIEVGAQGRYKFLKEPQQIRSLCRKLHCHDVTMEFFMPGPLAIISTGGALIIPAATTAVGVIVGGAITTGVGLSWLASSNALTTTTRPAMDITYREFLKKRLAHYKQTQDLPPNEAMKLIGPEWQQFKADHQTVTSSPSQHVAQSKLRGQSEGVNENETGATQKLRFIVAPREYMERDAEAFCLGARRGQAMYHPLEGDAWSDLFLHPGDTRR